MKQQILISALTKVAKPLVRIALRNQIPHKTLSEILKAVYVDVAASEFAVDGRKQTKSRISVLTGLTRKDVQRLLEEDLPIRSEDLIKHNRTARLIAAWNTDKQYFDDAGAPKVLSSTEFDALVQQHGGDMPARAMLDELLRTGMLEQTDDGYALLTRNYIPANSEGDKLGILGTSGADLLNTIDHNLTNETHDAWYQRYASNEQFPVNLLPELQDLCNEHAQALLVKVDNWMSEQEQPAESTDTTRVGLGIYYFEDSEYRD